MHRHVAHHQTGQSGHAARTRKGGRGNGHGAHVPHGEAPTGGSGGAEAGMPVTASRASARTEEAPTLYRSVRACRYESGGHAGPLAMN